MKVYADASFLVSLYYLDAHSAEAERRMRRSVPAPLLTPLAELELINALELRLSRWEASAAEIQAAKNIFEKDIHDAVYSTAPMPATVYQLARQISTRKSSVLGTRTLDILHVACASLLGAESFWTFDDRQAQLARAEGLKVR